MMKLPILNLLVNLLLLLQSKEWVNTEIQSEEKVNTKMMRLPRLNPLNMMRLPRLNLLLQLFQSEERIMRLPRLNLLLQLFQ